MLGVNSSHDGRNRHESASELLPSHAAASALPVQTALPAEPRLPVLSADAEGRFIAANPRQRAGVAAPRVCGAVRRRLPEDANGRLQLVGVTACGDADWEIAPYQEPRPCGCRGCRPSRPAPCLLRVNIPVVCQVQAECGQVLRGESVLTTDVALPIRCVQAECWRNQMMVLPCVRLIDGGAPVCADDCRPPVFDCTIELLVEAYMTRWEACGTPAPTCPDLPLFPPPPFG